MGLFSLVFNSGEKRLPAGRVEVTRGDDDQIVLSFIGHDGKFQWFKFQDDASVGLLAEKLDAVAKRVVDHA